MSPRGQIQFCESNHMKAFMEEKSIISLFKKYANSRSLKIGHRTSQAHTFNRKGREKKFHLPSNRCDLRKLVSEYVNPYRIKERETFGKWGINQYGGLQLLIFIHQMEQEEK